MTVLDGMGRLAYVCAAIAALGGQALADVDRPEPTESDRVAADALRRVRAARRAGDIAIDGQLDEAAWFAAGAATGFWQREPHEGQPVEHETEFRVLYDDAALYIGVRAADDEPHKVRGLLTRRDTDSSSDWILVGIDSYHDRRTSFTFALNPAGVQRDFLIYDDVMEDASWNAVWEGACSVDEQGWVAEFRIPYSQLRFASADEQVWGIQVARVVQRTQEVSFWTETPTSKQQRVSLFGEVEGIRDIKPSRRVELLPYTVGGARVADVDPDDPLNNEVSPELGLGVDFQLGVTTNLTLSGTVNPDFGQVEADPSQVNLTANETFFPEKRPFFLEGADIFQFGLSQGDGEDAVEQLFYSRRIGAPPHGGASDDAVYARQDATTNIIGAAKLSGKTSTGWSIGALTAVTSKEVADVELEDGGRDEQIIEPFANYTVLRLKKDFNNGRTNVGGAMTGVHRALDGTGMEVLHDRAYAGGLQLSHRSRNSRWSGDARVVGSSVHGDAVALDETQRSSQHYFQRPDADHLDYDPTRTHMAGFGAMGVISYNGKSHWRGATGFDSRSPGLEVNDLGFQRNADYVVPWVWAQYRDEKSGDVLRRYHLNTNMWTSATWAPERTSTGGNVNGSFTFRNYWGVGGGININGDVLDTRLLRGGPAVKSSLAHGGWFNAWTDSRARVRGNIGGNWWLRSEGDSSNWSGFANASIQARSNLDITVGPFASLRVDDTQFVDEVADMSGAPHYVLARIDQTTVGMTLRLDYTVSPDLSLQVYAQPFVAAGAYTDYKEAEDPRAADYADRFHTFGDGEIDEVDGELRIDRDGDGVADFAFAPADFNFRQLRSTVVVRWEYRPGSTLFFIWSHDRSSVVEDGAFSLGSDLSELADERGEHVVLFKLNYWLGV